MEKIYSATETSTQGYLPGCNANGDDVVSIMERQQGMACLVDVALGSLDKPANCTSRSSYLRFQDAEALR